jgi:hypothetical protein
MRGTTETTKTGGRCEIPRGEWDAFFLQFSHDHQEWLVDAARRRQERVQSVLAPPNDPSNPACEENCRLTNRSAASGRAI